jgi:hypothetical protein
MLHLGFLCAGAGLIAVAGAALAHADEGAHSRAKAARAALTERHPERAIKESETRYRNKAVPDKMPAADAVDGADARPLSPAPAAIVAGPPTPPPPAKRDRHKLVVGLSVAGAILVVGAAAVGAVVAEQMQAEYHPWGTLGITPH